jgi:hypothetical protein
LSIYLYLLNRETTGAKLVDGGVSELKKLLAAIEKGGGGLLFVDEAYTLNPNEALSQGKQVLDFLLPEMENKVVCYHELYIFYFIYYYDIYYTYNIFRNNS